MFHLYCCSWRWTWTWKIIKWKVPLAKHFSYTWTLAVNFTITRRYAKGKTTNKWVVIISHTQQRKEGQQWAGGNHRDKAQCVDKTDHMLTSQYSTIYWNLIELNSVRLTFCSSLDCERKLSHTKLMFAGASTGWVHLKRKLGRQQCNLHASENC